MFLQVCFDRTITGVNPTTASKVIGWCIQSSVLFSYDTGAEVI